MGRAEPIAVIGLACRVPGAATPDEFWSLLQRGGCAIGPVPASRWTWSRETGFPPQRSAASFEQGGFIEGLELFDADFFGLAPAEAARLDPQQKLALEVAWQALENAALVPAALAGSHTGVVMGVAHGDHAARLKADRASYDGRLGPNGYDCFVAHRLSYFFNFKGPSYSVNSACASSLQALHLAAQALRSGECDLVLAGGVNVHLAVDETVSCAMAGWLAADQRCKSFSEGGDGYVRGEGCGVVVLKRLADAQRDGDPLWGVLAGSATGHSGLTHGISWPSGNGQRDVLRRALRHSGLVPGEIDALEAHGSGNAMSDRIEAAALRDVLGSERAPGQPLRVGCCKPNIGHLEAAAGIAGLIKLLLCLREGELPAIAGLRELNSGIAPSDTLQWLTAPSPWPRRPDRPRRAILSNISFGGSTAALVVEDAPPDLPPAPAAPAALPGPLALALRARRPGGLDALRRSLHRALDAGGLTHDMVHTLNLHRSEFRQRVAYLGDDLAHLAAAVQQDRPAQRVASTDFPPALHGARPLLLLGPRLLGHDWPEPAAELRRWFVTARLLDAWQAAGGSLHGSPDGAERLARLAGFWAFFFQRLGIASPTVIVLRGLLLQAPLPGTATVLAAPADGDLRTLALPATPLLFSPQAGGLPPHGELPVLTAGAPADDWRGALARLLLGLYCLGAPLDWTWFACGRKTPLVTTPFDRSPSWFQPSEPACPAAAPVHAAPSTA